MPELKVSVDEMATKTKLLKPEPVRRPSNISPRQIRRGSKETICKICLKRLDNDAHPESMLSVFHSSSSSSRSPSPSPRPKDIAANKNYHLGCNSVSYGDCSSTHIDIDQILEHLLDCAPTNKTLQLTELQLRELCLQAREVFLSQPTLLRLDAPLNIMGDIHGQYEDLLGQFETCGYPPLQNYLFLGDYVDRGKRSLESIALLLAYKVKFPENIFLLRGNHECASINRLYGFYDECKRRFNIKLWKSFTDCFNCLPIACIVENSILTMHGGLSPDLKSLQDIDNVERPCDVPESGVICDLLWADPDEDTAGWGENDRGVSFTFGADVVRNFLTKHKLSLIVRAHQVVEDGYQFFAKRKLVTLFSAPNYCGEFDNAAAVMHVAEDLTCSFTILPVGYILHADYKKPLIDQLKI